MAELVSVATGYNHVNLTELVRLQVFLLTKYHRLYLSLLFKLQGLHNGVDPDTGSLIIDEDKILDALEDAMSK